MNKLAFFIILALTSPFFNVVQAEELKTLTAEYKTTPKKLTLDGTFEAVNQATVTAKTSGTIVEINFDVNDFVEKDQVLLKFQGTRNKAGKAQAQAGVKLAEARVTEARSEFNRMSTLYKKKMVTASQMEQAKAAFRTAEAQLESAKAQLISAGEGVSDTVVHAPFSGYVMERHVELGENANPGMPLFTGMSLDTLRVLAYIPQNFVATISKRKKAKVFVDAGEESLKELQVKKFTLFPFAKQGSFTIGVRLELESGIKGVLPGMLAKVVFDIGEEKRLLIPNTSVVRRSEVTGVYMVYADNRVQLRQVRTGSVFGDHIEILSGLNEGEKIAVDPLIAGQTLQAQLKKESH